LNKEEIVTEKGGGKPRQMDSPMYLNTSFSLLVMLMTLLLGSIEGGASSIS